MLLPFGYTLNADFHGGWLSFLALILVLVVLIFLTNRRQVVSSGSLTRSSWLIIIFSRVIISLLLVIMLFDPDITLERHQSLPKRIAVLVDNSQSMATAWEGSQGELLAAIETRVDQLNALYPIDILSMDGEELKSAEIDFDGDNSSFDWSPDLMEPSTARYQAVLLFSDGHLNQGRSPLDQGWTSALPIYPVLPLEPRYARSLTLGQLSYQSPAERGGETDITAKVQQSGLLGESIVLEVRNEAGDLIGQKERILDQMLTELFIPVALPESGNHNLGIQISLSSGDLASKQTLKVIQEDPRKHVLLLSETLNPLHKFLRLNLPDSLIELASYTGNAQGAIDLATNDGFDLIILNDPGQKVLGKVGDEIIHDHRATNSPLILFFSGLNAMDTDWIELLELEQSRVDWEGEFPLAWELRSEELPLFLGLRGAGFAPEDIDEFPPVLLGQYMVSNQGAGLLSTRPGERTERIMEVSTDPLQVIFNGGNLWKLFFYPETKQPFTTFWSYLLEYLDAVEDFRPVQLTIQSESGETGEHIPVQIEIRDIDGSPVVSEVTVWQEDAAGNQLPLDLRREKIGTYKTVVSTKQAGEYEIFAQAYRFGELWGRDTSRITLTTFNEEGQSEGVDKVFLQRLAEHSNGGQVLTAADNSPVFPDQFFEKKSSFQLRGLRSSGLFFVLLMLLIFEWIVRRRNGLL